jgi:hypothetical protein
MVSAHHALCHRLGRVEVAVSPRQGERALKAPSYASVCEWGAALGGLIAVTAIFNAHGGLATTRSFAARFRPAMLVAAGPALLGASEAVPYGSRRGRKR